MIFLNFRFKKKNNDILKSNTADYLHEILTFASWEWKGPWSLYILIPTLTQMQKISRRIMQVPENIYDAT